MCLRIIFQLIILELVALNMDSVTGESVEGFCGVSISTYLRIVEHECWNYKKLPNDIKNPQSVETLRLGPFNIFSSKKHILRNQLGILREGDLQATNLVNLEGLLLVDCGVTMIEIGAFRGRNKLSTIDLSRNKLKELNLAIFQDTPNLKNLNLSSNDLTGFSNIFPRLDLTLLDMTSCNLNSLETNLFKNLGKLKELQIGHNKLKTIDWKVLKPMQSLKHVDFVGNPFYCNCKIKFLLDYLDSRSVNWNKMTYCSSINYTRSEDLNNKHVAKKHLGITWDKLDRESLACFPSITSLRKVNVFNTIITLECNYNGYPEPQVIWTKNGHLLEEDATLGIRKVILNKEPASTEFIHDFKQILHTSNNASNNYECFVSNAAGSDSKFIGAEPPNRIEFRILALILAVVVLAMILISASVYVAIWYSKTKARLLKKEIYRDVQGNPSISGPKSTGEPPYPPLLNNRRLLRENE